MSYWDTSALAKLYVPEPDSAFFVAHAAKSRTAVTFSRLALWEMWRVVLRKETVGALRPNAAEIVMQQIEADILRGRLNVRELDERVAEEFGRAMRTCYRLSPPLELRTQDALHLATAREAGETEFVATDKRLREAAERSGFSVVPR